MFHYAGLFDSAVNSLSTLVERGVRHFLMGFVVFQCIYSAYWALCALARRSNGHPSDPAYFVLAGRMSIILLVSPLYYYAARKRISEYSSTDIQCKEYI